MIVKNFNFMEKLEFLEDVLASQNIGSRYFYSYANIPPTFPHRLWSHNSLPGSIITPQATMTWNIRLFIFCMICNFLKCDDFTFL